MKTHEGGLGRVGSLSDAYPNRTYATIAPRFALLNVWNRLIEVLDKKIGRTGLNLIEALIVSNTENYDSRLLAHIQFVRS